MAIAVATHYEKYLYRSHTIVAETVSTTLEVEAPASGNTLYVVGFELTVGAAVHLSLTDGDGGTKLWGVLPAANTPCGLREVIPELFRRGALGLKLTAGNSLYIETASSAVVNGTILTVELEPGQRW